MSDTSAPVASEATVSAPSPATAPTTADITPLGDRPVSTNFSGDDNKAPQKVEVVQAKPKTAMDSLKEAQAKSDRNEKERVSRETANAPVKTDPKVEAAKPTENGKPAGPDESQTAKPKLEAPSRWTATAKAKWEALDDEVKAETSRTVSELEKGMNQYKARATQMDELKEYEDIAKQHGTTVAKGLANYVALDKSLQSQNPAEKLRALDEVFKAAKVDKAEFARFVLQQAQNPQAQQNPEVASLKAELAQLRQTVQGTSQTIEQQQRTQIESQVNQWMASKPHAAHLENEIAAYIGTGLQLNDAYDKAVSDFQAKSAAMGFIPQAPNAPVTTPAPQPQPLKGQKSISGSPGPGSYQATSKPSNSPAEAVRRAMEAAGLA